jgi:membrane protein YdbS with pleckstrin-like domain
VPDTPPVLPAPPGDRVESFKPAPAFLTYLKFWFWLSLVVPGLVLTIASVSIATALIAAGWWWLAVPLFGVALALAVLTRVPAFIAVCLRYDTTWYVMSGRSMRIRRGIWVIEETTITFENVQNVAVTQGPLQRYFGIADVLVDTAGGSSDAKQKGSGHRGVIEGVTTDAAARLREMILARVRSSVSAGLGDEEHHGMAAAAGSGLWSPEHVAMLREIRDGLKAVQAIG